jgi:DNA-binding NarL/FixJ family response regulator
LNRRLRILVAVEPRELSRVILHLLVSHKDAEVVCSVTDPDWLLRYTQRVLPHLIIADTRFSHFSTTLDALRNASPGVKVILTSLGESPGVGHSVAADARLSNDTLVDQLIPTVRKLCEVSTAMSLAGL